MKSSMAGKLPAASTKPAPATRDRTPGPAIPKGANPLEMKKMENSIKDKEAEVARLLAQVQTLQTEKTTLTKERAEKEAQATKATKEKNDVLAKAEKEKKDMEDKATREKETVKKSYEARLASMQT